MCFSEKQFLFPNVQAISILIFLLTLPPNEHCFAEEDFSCFSCYKDRTVKLSRSAVLAMNQSCPVLPTIKPSLLIPCPAFSQTHFYHNRNSLKCLYQATMHTFACTSSVNGQNCLRKPIKKFTASHSSRT
jgi:hypothetical protein